MGSRGPARTPTRVKLHLGETRPSHLNLLEPKPSRDLPKMPRDMEPEARVVWRRVLRTQAPDVITAADTDLLRAYCESVASYQSAMRLLVRSGPLVRGQKGELVKNPLHQIVRDNRDAIRLIGRELGLSPASRAGLQIARGPAMNTVDADLGLPPRLRAVGDED